MTDAAIQILAQGGFPRMRELHAVLRRHGIQAELLAPPGASGNS
ncbi:MAG: hypothetical protein WD226_04075 [Planctomycetota bacterium]